MIFSLFETKLAKHSNGWAGPVWLNTDIDTRKLLLTFRRPIWGWNDPKQEFDAISSGCIHFFCDVFVFLFSGYTQHIVKVWKKHICNFLKYSKINNMGLFTTPSWTTVCAKKFISEKRKNIKMSLWISIYKGRCKASVSSSFISSPKWYLCPTCLGSTLFQYSNALCFVKQFRMMK